MYKQKAAIGQNALKKFMYLLVCKELLNIIRRDYKNIILFFGGCINV